MSSSYKSTIEKFLDKVKRASVSRSKQVSLTIEEANELASSLGLALNDIVDLQKDIIDLQKKDSVITLDVNGGKF